jgi:hypothetical protein
MLDAEKLGENLIYYNGPKENLGRGIPVYCVLTSLENGGYFTYTLCDERDDGKCKPSGEVCPYGEMPEEEIRAKLFPKFREPRDQSKIPSLRT